MYIIEEPAFIKSVTKSNKSAIRHSHCNKEHEESWCNSEKQFIYQKPQLAIKSIASQ